MSQIELKHLKMLTCMSQTRNMTRAAQMLFITQSALSQQLKEIETRLNTKLFTRTGKEMIITRVGKKLLKTAKTIIETLEDTELEIAKTISGESGELKVGTRCVFCYKWLPKVLSLFYEKYPNIVFDLGTSKNIEKELESNTYDLIITGTNMNSDRFECFPLFTDQLVGIMAPNHPFSQKPYLEFKDFSQTCLISYTEKKKHAFFHSTLIPMKIEPKQYMVVEQHQATIEMVVAGFGISVVPAWSVKDQLESKQLVALPITRKGIEMTWQATILKNSALTVSQKEFIQIVSRLPMFDTSNLFAAAKA